MDVTLSYILEKLRVDASMWCPTRLSVSVKLSFCPLSLIPRNLTSKQWTNIHVNESVIDMKYQPIFTI